MQPRTSVRNRPRAMGSPPGAAPGPAVPPFTIGLPVVVVGSGGASSPSATAAMAAQATARTVNAASSAGRSGGRGSVKGPPRAGFGGSSRWVGAACEGDFEGCEGRDQAETLDGGP